MRLRIEIENVAPVDRLVFEADLAEPGLRCIVGRNGTGKTTLAKAFLNLAFADTFVRTASAGVIGPSSRIRYLVGDDEFLFAYDLNTRSISTRYPVPEAVKRMLAVELPPPHGQRFTFFRTLADSDDQIRRAIVLGQYDQPHELIAFLSAIYGDDRFADLVQVTLKRGTCCCFVRDDLRYVREDHFSSGEYFLIHLYRLVATGRPLIFIDEIDTSLDASAQARLASQLRALCQFYGSTVVFTSHSLALMQTLESGELAYLEAAPGETTLVPMSFNSVKSILFGFQGWDRYILTEDDVLKRFVQYVIQRYCPPAFYKYIIIHVGGGSEVTGLMRRNRSEQFFGPKEQVISVLDGDQMRDDLPLRTICIPLPSVEKALWAAYRTGGFPYTFAGGDELADKPLFKKIIKLGIRSEEEIFQLLSNLHNAELLVFAQTLAGFISRA